MKKLEVKDGKLVLPDAMRLGADLEELLASGYTIELMVYKGELESKPAIIRGARLN